jgi:hypothetical protein
MNPGEVYRLKIESLNDFYNYMLLNRVLQENFICNVWSDHKEYIIESTDNKDIFYVTPVAWYDGNTKISSNNAWFPYLKYPLLVL